MKFKNGEQELLSPKTKSLKDRTWKLQGFFTEDATQMAHKKNKSVIYKA